MAVIGAAFGVVGRAAWLGAKTAVEGGKIAYGMAGPAMSAAFAVGTPVAKAGLAGAGRAAGFGLRHPQAAMAAGVAGLGLYALSGTGAGTSNMNNREVDALAARTGPSTGFTPGRGSMAYDPRRMRFTDSTQGLVQGLHRGRH